MVSGANAGRIGDMGRAFGAVMDGSFFGEAGASVTGVTDSLLDGLTRNRRRYRTDAAARLRFAAEERVQAPVWEIIAAPDVWGHLGEVSPATQFRVDHVTGTKETGELQQPLPTRVSYGYGVRHLKLRLEEGRRLALIGSAAGEPVADLAQAMRRGDWDAVAACGVSVDEVTRALAGYRDARGEPTALEWTRLAGLVLTRQDAAIMGANLGEEVPAFFKCQDPVSGRTVIQALAPDQSLETSFMALFSQRPVEMAVGKGSDIVFAPKSAKRHSPREIICTCCDSRGVGGILETANSTTLHEIGCFVPPYDPAAPHPFYARLRAKIEAGADRASFLGHTQADTEGVKAKCGFNVAAVNYWLQERYGVSEAAGHGLEADLVEALKSAQGVVGDVLAFAEQNGLLWQDGAGAKTIENVRGQAIDAVAAYIAQDTERNAVLFAQKVLGVTLKTFTGVYETDRICVRVTAADQDPVANVKSLFAESPIYLGNYDRPPLLSEGVEPVDPSAERNGLSGWMSAVERRLRPERHEVRMKRFAVPEKPPREGALHGARATLSRG